MALPLPPLNALRAFEAAARAGSYVGAARELGVSPAAVSQQVKNLELFLGKQLFRRHNNRVTLTDAGRAIFGGASEALQAIATLTRQTMTGRMRARLVISALPSVANAWLAPRLAAYARDVPDFRFDLRVEDDPVDFDRHDIDLRLCYGSNLYPELASVRLCQDVTLPMASPDYLVRNPRPDGGDLAGIPDDDLIHTEWGPSFGSHPAWQAWFGQRGEQRPAPGTGYRAGMSSLALDLAIAGAGVALGQRLLALDALAAGRLVLLSDRAIALGHPYDLVHPRSKARKPGLARLIAFLVAAAG